MKNSMDNLSYEKLLENKEFLNNTRNVLYDSFGEDHVLSTDEEILDAFYENFGVQQMVTSTILKKRS